MVADNFKKTELKYEAYQFKNESKKKEKISFTKKK